MFAIFATTLLFSCKKNEEKKTEASIVGQWKITARTSDKAIDWYGNGTLTNDLFSNERDCDKDDIFVFYATGTYEGNEGPTKCGQSPQIHTQGNWSKSGNTLTLTVDGEVMNGSIIQLDDKVLKLTNSTDHFGTDYIATTTFQRQ